MRRSRVVHVTLVASLLLLLCATAVVCARRIRHVVVLMEENRSFDHLLGWRGRGSNGLNGTEYNDVVDPATGRVTRVVVTDKAKNVAQCDPDHDLPPTSEKIFGVWNFTHNRTAVESMSGFAQFEDTRARKDHHGKDESNYCGVMDMFSTKHLPVLNALADEFLLMDRFFASVPGPTWPNRLFHLTGTSAGLTETSNPWYRGVTGKLFPQRSIFDQIREAGLTWRNYVNDTPWELMLDGVASYPENVVLLSKFFEDCAVGELPAFSFINPRAGINFTSKHGSNDQHPDHDVSLGEALVKDVYEAVRSSPRWNETLFIVTYDEHGGFYDHVPPPRVGVPPPGDGEASYPDQFGFDRLGIRIPTLLVSPWVSRGSVVSSPPDAAKPFRTSEFDLTSIMASARELLAESYNIPHLATDVLTERDRWAARFTFALNEPNPRSDCHASSGPLTSYRPRRSARRRPAYQPFATSHGRGPSTLIWSPRSASCRLGIGTWASHSSGGSSKARQPVVATCVPVAQAAYVRVEVVQGDDAVAPLRWRRGSSPPPLFLLLPRGTPPSATRAV